MHLHNHDEQSEQPGEFNKAVLLLLCLSVEASADEWVLSRLQHSVTTFSVVSNASKFKCSIT